jgi:RNA polymerase sigma-70 factor (ECF subfamily)
VIGVLDDHTPADLESPEWQMRTRALILGMARVEESEAGSGRQLDPSKLGDHIDRLYAAARALCGSPTEAEDLVQETFAKVLRKPRFLRGEDDLGYLLHALRNTYFSSRRTASRRPQETELPDELPVADPREGLRPDRAVESAQVYDVLATLPDQYREAIVAVDLVGLSYKEAAKALGTREGTIMSRLFRGRQKVAEQLER